MGLLTKVALIALISILAHFDGRLESRWGPITLNTVIAILSTIASSALLAFVGPALSQHLWNAFAQTRKAKDVPVARAARDLCILDGASRGPWGSLELLLRLRELFVESSTVLT